MALQFFAVHSEALATTHDALQRHASAHGLRPPGPTRALRVAQLFGHLQLRSAGRSSVVVALSELAATWRFQPRQLRQDLALLQALGWLSARGTTRGTVISLSGPDPADRADGDGQPAQGFPEPAAPYPAKTEPAAPCAAQPEPEAPCAAQPEPEASRTAPPAPVAPRAAQPEPAAQLVSAAQVTPDSSSTPPETAKAPKADESRDLLQRLAGLYNQHRPSTWPAYQPRGNGLGTKLRQALRQAGSADALADTLTVALRAMPPFWRTTYPQGRSGSECMAALFSTDRGCAGLGVEFWHLFSWSQAALECCAESGGDWSDPETSERAPMAAGHPGDEFQRARRLFLWDSGVWRGQGREALLLSQQEKRELALLLEASGEGIPGTAEQQFLDPAPAPEPEPDPEPPELPELPKAPAPSAAPSEAGTAGNGQPAEFQPTGEQPGGEPVVGPQEAQPAKAQEAQPEPHHGPPRGAHHRADRSPNCPSPVQPTHSRQTRQRRPAHRKPSLRHQCAGP
jgi:hypothetical protein